MDAPVLLPLKRMRSSDFEIGTRVVFISSCSVDAIFGFIVAGKTATHKKRFQAVATSLKYVKAWNSYTSAEMEVPKTELDWETLRGDPVKILPSDSIVIRDSKHYFKEIYDPSKHYFTYYTN